MLVLTRKLDESIIIGDNIVVTILGMDRDKVKLGIQAPREIPVMRQEIYQAVQEQSIVVASLVSDPKAERFSSLRELLTGETPEEEPVVAEKAENE